MWAGAVRSGSLEDIQLLRIACFKEGNKEQLLALENYYICERSQRRRAELIRRMRFGFFGWGSKRALRVRRKKHTRWQEEEGKKSRNPSLTLTFAAPTQCWALLSSCSPNKNLIKYLKSRWRGICKSKSCDLGSSKHFPHIITSYADLCEEKKRERSGVKRVLEGNSACLDRRWCCVWCWLLLGCWMFAVWGGKFLS